MELEQILDQRWSCRAFEAEPVAQETLDGIFALAQRTASWCNTQPWRVHLLSGDARDALSKALIESVLAGSGGTDYPMPDYVGVSDDRRKVAGFGLYAALEIAREDKLARGAQMLKNFEFFGAPHVAVITSDAPLGFYGGVDCGGFVANLVNAAHAAGLGTCAQGAIAMQAPVVREFLDLPEDRLVVCAVAIGRPDLNDRVNDFRTERAEAEQVVTYLS
ncbi:nitroreductase [Nocardioides sp. Bht2]|uniref:nitroreductase n=1 Tax=Nocardioides sp. Bht2 TaxID=3392297 RepID=UPI0039B58AF0